MDVPLPSGRCPGEHTRVSLEPDTRCPAAKRFFLKALHSTAASAPQAHAVEERVEEPTATANSATSAPRMINVDKNAAYPQASAELKAAEQLPEQVELRQVKYLKNLIEQDHPFIKWVVKPGMGFFSFVRETQQVNYPAIQFYLPNGLEVVSIHQRFFPLAQLRTRLQYLWKKVAVKLHL